ncbi:MAG TPA: TMEM165/GDT1 family protein [Holophagaceae bacterium]|nr:TMEM165/GDT1 family protein [Holophagaceae bacterium]
MNKELFWGTFVAVFLAEVGDKTSLAAMTASAKSGAAWTVFCAASLALVCATAIGVSLGGVLFKVVPPAAIKWVAGLLFIGVGLWVLAGKTV